MHPTATTLAPVSAAASTVSMESFLALATNAQVFTTTTSAPDGSATSWYPPICSRPAISEESTSLRAQPRVTRFTRVAGGAQIGIDAEARPSAPRIPPDGGGTRPLSLVAVTADDRPALVVHR